MKNKIYINADDYCYDVYRTKAINKLIKLKKINSTTIIINNFDHEYKNIDFNLLQDIEIGLHMNLTYGKPLGRGYKTIVKNGYFLPLNQFIPKLILGKIDISEVISEFNLQLQKFENLFGRIEYMDGHHHIHLYKNISKVTQDVVKEFNIHHVRSPSKYLFTSLNGSNLLLNFLIDLNSLKKYQRTKYLVGFDLSGKKLKSDIINRYIDKYDSLEVMVHPHCHMHEMPGLLEVDEIIKFNV